jgi:hypothetical protein
MAARHIRNLVDIFITPARRIGTGQAGQMRPAVLTRRASA